MRILMIINHIPYPPSSGASIRIYNLLKRLACEHEIWIVAFTRDEKQDAQSIAHLRTFCAGVESVVVPNLGALERPWQALEYFFKGRPMELRHFYSHALVNKIRELTAQHHFDVVQIEDSYMGLYLEALPTALQHRSVVTFHDVVFSRADRIARVELHLLRRIRMWLYGRMMRDWEPFYMENFGRCIVVSEMDRKLLLSCNPRLKIDVVPNGIDTQQFRPVPYSDDNSMLLFVGNMGYRPNVDAVSFFCKQIFPLIRAKAPQAEVCVTGLNPAPEVLALAGEGVRVTGTVEDVRPYYAQSAVCIVPLRAGGGTRLKILEAMALGRPVVSTSIGCEGLDVQDGVHLFIADTPEDFAAKTLLLLNEPYIRESIIQSGRELAEKHYDWDIIARQLLKSYQEVAQ
jgi:polysaccharide biosynthesis protein PslH